VKKFSAESFVIESKEGRKISLDIHIPLSKKPVPVVVFCHGFKGFKDWGHFNWVAESCMPYEMAFLKFNFSMNGVKSDQLTEISDLEAFGNNNYTIELEDLDEVLNWIDKMAEELHLDNKQINLIGHSRGGGIALLKSAEDKRVKRLVLWASLSDFDSFFRTETIQEWEKNGVVYAANKRTGQQLPLNKQFYDNYLKNKETLDLNKAAKLLSIPLLIIHGTNDESVPVSHAESLYETVTHSIFVRVEGGNHTFGAKHPFDPENDVTEMLEELVENTFEFMVD
jgi:fermentation-respiration switch protein FrsA (DUF1100 family)